MLEGLTVELDHGLAAVCGAVDEGAHGDTTGPVPPRLEHFDVNLFQVCEPRHFPQGRLDGEKGTQKLVPGPGLGDDDTKVQAPWVIRLAEGVHAELSRDEMEVLYAPQTKVHVQHFDVGEQGRKGVVLVQRARQPKR